MRAIFSRTLTATALTAALAFTAAAQATPEEVTYLLPAPATLPAFAPWMLAQHKGYYAEENLKVNFVSGKGGVDVAKQLGAGNAVIGGAMGDTSLIVRANGVPVKAVAVLGDGAMSQTVVKDDGPIKTVKDLKGKTLTTIAYTDTGYYALLGSLKMAAGLTRNDLDIQAAGPVGVWQLFAAGKADGMQAVPEWIASAEEAGTKVRVLEDARIFPGMAQAILASDEAIAKQPDLIKRLVRATLRGMQDIMDDPKAAAAQYAEAVPGFKGKEELVERIFNSYRTTVYKDQKPLGKVDPQRLLEVQKFYVNEGIVAKPSTPSDLYTNQFIDGAQ